MDRSSLKQFQTIARLGNISKAALELHAAQPSLSLMIKRLEADLGTSLFERSKRGVTLTAAGQRFLRHCDQTLQSWEDLRSELGASVNEVAGEIRLGAHPSVSFYAFPQFLPKLMAEFPALEINLSHDLSRRLLEKVAEQTLDVGLIINPEPRPQLILRKLLADEVTVFRAKQPLLPDVLLFDPNLNQVQKIREQLRLKGLNFKRTFRSGNLELIAQMTRHGLGQAILPKRILEGLGFPFFESYPEIIKPVRDQLFLVYRPEFIRAAKGKAFVKAVRAAFSF